MLNSLLLVALGGAVGASLRYLLGLAIVRVAPPDPLPLALIIANIVGSALLGFFVGIVEQREVAHLTPFITTGVLGGFTTFSGFCMDVLTLYDRGDPGWAVAYLAITVFGSLSGMLMGLQAAKLIVP